MTTNSDYGNMRVLFTVPPTHSAVTDYGAILTSHVHDRRVNKFLSASYPIPSWGLSWIKENCPTVEILDMPKWSGLKRELRKGVDILGISFYTYQVPDVIRLVELARKYGVKEIWGGNYAKRKTSLSKILLEMIKRGALDDAFDGDSILSTLLKQAFRLSSLLRQPSSVR